MEMSNIRTSDDLTDVWFDWLTMHGTYFHSS